MSKKFNLATAREFVGAYTPERLFAKISKYGKKASVKACYAALLLYYAVLDKEVPWKDKAVVLGALGYFILPLDFLPDFLPGGYADDMSALFAALKTIWNNITPSTHEKARRRLAEWFPNIPAEDLKLF